MGFLGFFTTEDINVEGDRIKIRDIPILEMDMKKLDGVKLKTADKAFKLVENHKGFWKEDEYIMYGLDKVCGVYKNPFFTIDQLLEELRKEE